MTTQVKVWEANRKGVSIYRGPLAYSLKIGEKWERYGGTDRWPAFEVFPTTPWNFGLVLDQEHPEKSVKVKRRAAVLPPQPFNVTSAPIELTVQAKRIPEWTLETNGLIEELEDSPVYSREMSESVTLIPMGCARLRVSVFPVIGDEDTGHRWKKATQ